MDFKVNSYQTQLTQDLLNSLEKEVAEDLLDAITNIEFIKRLISPDRKRAKDLERDDKGRIVVDLVAPHIIEDMEYFRPTGNYFREHGVLTHLRPNPNPNSEFKKWLDRETDRCWHGMVRESDGEWVTGDMYFYLNYVPILQSKAIAGSRRAQRIYDFPECWEATYLWFHYVDQARSGGIYDDFAGGSHCVHIARRGIGKSFSSAAMLAKLFIVGESLEVKRANRGVAVSFKSEYLTKDGILNKFVDAIDFCAEYTHWPHRRLKSSMQEMLWKMGYLDGDTGVMKGTLNEVIGVTTKDDSDKVRGKRAQKIIYEEFGANPNFLETWNTTIPSVQEGDFAFGQLLAQGCVCAGTKVYKADGSIINIEDLKESDGILGYKDGLSSVEEITYMQDPAYKDCVKITTIGGREILCSVDHPFLSRLKGAHKRSKGFDFRRASDLKEGDFLSLYIGGTKFGEKEMYNPRLLGLLLGDGSYANSSYPTLSITSNEIYDYVDSNFNIGINKLRECNDGSLYSQVYFKGIKQDLVDLGIWGQSKELKSIIKNASSYRKEDICEYLGGYFDADGNVQITKSGIIVKLTSKHKHLLEGVQDLLLKLGINSNIQIERKGGGTLKSGVNKKETEMLEYDCHVLYISNIHHVKKFRDQIKFLSKDKQERLQSVDQIKDPKIYIYDNLQVMRIKSIEPIGRRRIYNLTANNSNTYIANGFVTHNTGGSEGSDFTGALEIIYNPLGYNVYPLPNVFDRNSQGKNYTVFFSGGYMNRKGFYNKDGVSDVVGALISILKDRFTLKYNSTDPTAVTRRKAEIPITIQDAIMQITSTIYPVADLTDRLNQIDLDPSSLDDVLVGELGFKNGEVSFKPSIDNDPIRYYPHKDNKQDGAVEIFKMPELDNTGKAFRGRYILGADTFDDDHSNTLSLGAVKVLDLWTDKLVAQYTGRRQFADEFFEICRRLTIFYNGELLYENNKKGMFGYFQKMNSLYLLADVPEYLRDKDLVKGELYGNKAHPYSEHVYTPKGKLKWGDVKVGDFIYSTYNTLTQVIDIPFDSITDIYEIKLKDGRKVKASGNHLWRVIDWNGHEKILSTLDIKKYYYRNKGKYKEYKYYIPKNLGVNFEHREVKISPYFLGLLLGDGSLTKVTKNTVGFTSNIQDMKFYMEKLKYKYKTFDDRHHHIYIQNIKDLIKKLNLENTKSRTKFIPDIYKFNSYNVRLDILRGLMDTDGSIGGDGNPTYTSVSKQLAQDVLWVGRSLGINGNLVVSENPFGKVYTVRFYTDTPLFYLERKNSKQRVSKTRHLKTAITYIKFVGRERAKCVSVDSHDSCYLVNDFITTHNSKGSPSTAPIKGHGRTLLRDWLLKPQNDVVFDDDGNSMEVTFPLLMTLKSRSLIQELTLWNSDANFDEHDAMVMLMLLRQERLILHGEDGPSEKSHVDDSSYIGNDPFFTKNYDDRFGDNSSSY